MSGLDESVQIVITPETRSVAIANFGQMLVLGPNINAATRTIEIASLTEAATYLCNGTADPEYLQIQAAFAQRNSPATIKLGSVRGTKKLTDSGTWTSGGSVSCKVNGVLCSASFNTDLATSMTALAAAIDTNCTAFADAAYASHVVTITPKTGYVLAVTKITLTSVVGTLAIALTATATEAYDDALGNIQLYDDAWYLLSCASTTVTDLTDIAAWVEASDSPKFFMYASSDSTIINSNLSSDTTSVAKLMYSLALERTAGFYSGTAGNGATAATQAVETAMQGYIASYAPGSYNPAYSRLALITPDALTVTQEHNSRGYYDNGVLYKTKNTNTFEALAGFNIVRWGLTAAGGWIDLRIFTDWLIASLQAAVYGVMVNTLKIPYDYTGYAMIEGAMRNVFNQAQLNGAVTAYLEDEDGLQIGGYSIVLPALGDVDPNDKAARLLKNITWSCWYSGAINSVKMTGTIIQ